MGFGFLIKELLRDRKMTIKQLAEEADIPLNTLYSITKRDSKRVDPVIIARISDVLGITVGDLSKIQPKDSTPESWEIYESGIAAMLGAGWAFSKDIASQIQLAQDGFAKFDSLEEELHFYFHRLNDSGQKEAIKNIGIIAGNPKYQRTDPLPSHANFSPSKKETPPEGQETASDGQDEDV